MKMQLGSLEKILISSPELQLVLHGQWIFGDIFVNKFPLKHVPNVFEINEDKFIKINVVIESYAMFFSF